MRKNIFGKTKIKVSKEQKNNAMNVILINSLCYKKARILDDSSLEITVATSSAARFLNVFEDNGIKAQTGKSEGLLAIAERYRSRWGFIAGSLFLLLALFISSKFVWRIDIDGNSRIPDEEIIRGLENVGFGLGTFIPSVDYDTLHNEFLLECGDVAWISVNISGNVARVLVRERIPEAEKKESTYSNVVAKCDAQIVLIKLYNGEKIVSAGDVVHKGDLLISGVIDSKSQGVRYVHADGIVNAYVSKTIEVKIPFRTTEKVYTGKIYTDKDIKIFSKSLNFSNKYRNYGEFCDTIETKERKTLFGSIVLPVETVTRKYYEYEYRDRTYTKEEAVDIAFKQLRSDMDKELEDAELISKSVKTSFDDEYFYVECNLFCLEDIADVVEFQAN
ncbi:MAG: sporulation protein YqfD [Eubacteriales bacterium]